MTPDLRSLCRSYTSEMIRVVTSIAREKSHPPAARVAAAGLIIERGWGKAQQDVSVDGDIKVTIRKMFDDDDEPAMIDVTPVRTKVEG